ncbi:MULTISPECIES: fibronectin type III domain-containing protein [Flavobacteriaceae]|uniref:fibronectin type III domain-containing protein n=1 Tax=Flavobacteriaceae TaxID=49546 RepID=UPI001492EEF3|nr:MULTISPECIES: fibronectin type III domain-containing protein [Allomuricauda]MDC6366236.1 fibronectin type III domain-containing protein [Muricauda sp. AC10]
MKKTNLFLICLFLSAIAISAQEGPQILVQPYLQNAEPNSITIMWQTSTGEESIVEWGTTPKLGKKTTGKTDKVNYGPSRIHEVELTDLKRFTEYYYRVKTGKLKSDIFQFKTPPFANEAESFNLIAMSDMQLDWQHTDKFSEIVNEGVIKYLENEFDGKLPDNLALVMVPGDLVENGSKYHQWKDHFFNPAEKLFAQVPVYPVLGNHERNSVFYFKYFSLPENGTPAYAEHWWYKDYGNVRIIGLNSNDGYADSRDQFDWLEKVLADTEKNNDIDFVFAQMHHPHKSELWIPGERKSSGKVVKMLEEFSTKTGKPSIHFFGHTHGYSRGQSKDHNHLWVNVASAGGAIDNWGEFEGRDYDEFTVTQDEYGFVMVSVDADANDPKITLKRISRGNNIVGIKNNEQTDSITVFKLSKNPKAPTAISPKGEGVANRGVVLKAGTFEGNRSGAFHAASQWQVSKTPDFEKPVYDSWKQHENWYYLENRQKDDDLTDESTNLLEPSTTYYWRVRYRDQYLNWSDWSETTSFKTK